MCLWSVGLTSKMGTVTWRQTTVSLSLSLTNRWNSSGIPTLAPILKGQSIELVTLLPSVGTTSVTDIFNPHTGSLCGYVVPHAPLSFLKNVSTCSQGSASWVTQADTTPFAPCWVSLQTEQLWLIHAISFSTASYWRCSLPWGEDG